MAENDDESRSPHLKIELAINLGGGSRWALDGVGPDRASSVADVEIVAGDGGGEGVGSDNCKVGWGMHEAERGVAAGCCVLAVEVRTGAERGADGCIMFEHLPLLAGRQVVQILPAFTHAQFLHLPSVPLHRQQTVILP